MVRTAVTRRAVNNLLRNGDFEYAPAFTAFQTGTNWLNGLAAGSSTPTPYGWFGIGGGTREVGFDPTIAHSGSYSMKLETKASGSDAGVYLYRNEGAEARERCIPVRPSTSYTVSAWIYTEYVSGDSNHGAFLTLYQLSNTGGGITGTSTTPIKVSAGWQRITLVVTTNASTYFMGIEPHIYGQTGAGTLLMRAWFDDIEFGPTSPLLRVAA